MDPLMISTALFGVGTVVFGAGYLSRGGQIDELMDENDRQFDTIVTQFKELRDLRGKEEARVAHLRSISAKGKAAQAEKAAAEKAGRAAAVSKTLNDAAATKMRSRAQVVAPVKAKRTRAKKVQSGAEVAAKKA